MIHLYEVFVGRFISKEGKCYSAIKSDRNTSSHTYHNDIHQTNKLIQRKKFTCRFYVSSFINRKLWRISICSRSILYIKRKRKIGVPRVRVKFTKGLFSLNLSASLGNILWSGLLIFYRCVLVRTNISIHNTSWMKMHDPHQEGTCRHSIMILVVNKFINK